MHLLFWLCFLCVDVDNHHKGNVECVKVRMLVDIIVLAMAQEMLGLGILIIVNMSTF